MTNSYPLSSSVQSPSDYLNKKPQPPVLDRRQSIAVVEGITNHRVIPSPTGTGSGPTSSHPTPTPTPPPPGPPHSHLLERKFSLQVTGVGEGQSLVDAMSARSSPGLSDMAMSQDALVRSVSYEISLTIFEIFELWCLVDSANFIIFWLTQQI